LSDFETGQIITRLAGASMTKSATLLGVSRATVSNVMSAYTNHGKTTSGNRNSEGKINTDTKRSSYIEKDCFEKSQNYCSTGDRTAKVNIHLDNPVSTKTAQCQLHKSNIHNRTAIAKPLITERKAQMHKLWCHDH
jgi:predicted transcriptional regulator